MSLSAANRRRQDTGLTVEQQRWNGGNGARCWVRSAGGPPAGYRLRPATGIECHADHKHARRSMSVLVIGVRLDPCRAERGPTSVSDSLATVA